MGAAPGRARPRGGFRVGPRPRDLLQGWLRRCRRPHVPHGARGRTPRGRWVAMPSAEASAPGAPAPQGWRRRRPCSARQTADSSCCSLLVSAHTGDRGTDFLHAAHQPVLISWGHAALTPESRSHPQPRRADPHPRPHGPQSQQHWAGRCREQGHPTTHVKETSRALCRSHPFSDSESVDYDFMLTSSSIREGTGRGGTAEPRSSWAACRSVAEAGRLLINGSSVSHTLGPGRRGQGSGPSVLCGTVCIFHTALACLK